MVVRIGENTRFDQIREAKTFFQRFLGLMGCKGLEEGEGILFYRCSSIHCFFMKITIDVIYLDKNYRVVGVETVKPWRIGHFYRGAAHILEVGEGAAKEVRVGDMVQIN